MCSWSHSVVIEPAKHKPSAMKVTDEVTRNTGKTIVGKTSAATPAQKLPTNKAIKTDKNFNPTLRIVRREERFGWVGGLMLAAMTTWMKRSATILPDDIYSIGKINIKLAYDNDNFNW